MTGGRTREVTDGTTARVRAAVRVLAALRARAASRAPAVLTALATLATTTVMTVSCRQPQSDVEQQREAAADAASREVPQSPLAHLKRTDPLTVADRQAWRAVLGWPDSCEEAFQMSRASDDGGLTFHAVSAGVSTVAILCAAGSYQPSHLFLRFDERGSSPEARLLEFPVPQSEDGRTVTRATETELAGEVVFSPDGHMLSVLSLARQLGDCGIWSRYAVATDHPKLTAAAAKLPCPATPGDPAAPVNGEAPGGWPALDTR